MPRPARPARAGPGRARSTAAPHLRWERSGERAARAARTAGPRAGYVVACDFIVTRAPVVGSGGDVDRVVGRLRPHRRRSVPVLRPAPRRHRDMRCSSGAGRGRARVTGRRPESRPLSRVQPSGIAARPLARETSAGTGGVLEARAVRLVQRGPARVSPGSRRLRSSGSGVRRGGWGQTPPGGPLRPGASRASLLASSAGDADDLVVVLAGCADCRSRREAPGSPSPPSGRVGA